MSNSGEVKNCNRLLSATLLTDAPAAGEGNVGECSRMRGFEHKNRYRAAFSIASPVILAVCAISVLGAKAQSQARQGISPLEQTHLVAHGRYLATIGVCSACHTPPNVAAKPSHDPAEISRDRTFKTDPDWFKYLEQGPRNSICFPAAVK